VPAPVIPEPAPVAPVAAPAAPAPAAPVPAAPKPAPPVPAATVPKPAPTPPPAPVTPPPAPEPAPEPELPPTVDVRGEWIGTADGRSMKLTVTSQSGDRFKGTAEVESDGGVWSRMSVSGSVSADGAMSFRQSGGASFNGKVSGLRASGTYTLVEGHVPMKWSVFK